MTWILLKLLVTFNFDFLIDFDLLIETQPLFYLMWPGYFLNDPVTFKKDPVILKNDPVTFKIDRYIFKIEKKSH